MPLSAYARVEPITLFKLNAAQAGIISGLTVLPGNPVKAGTILAHLTGPAVDGLLAQRHDSVEAAEAALAAAEKIHAGERRKQAAHLATTEAGYRAEADVIEARSKLASARAQLQTALASVVLRAPEDGIALNVLAAEGEQVQAGQTILTVQPQGNLWLVAQFYGSEALAVQVGMTGQFEPAEGGAAVPVRVKSVIGALGPDGGQAVGLVASVATPPWRNGESGRITLSGAEQTFVAVPTRALILDQGQWWVLVRTQSGNQRRQVIPGPSEGMSTLIKKGLEPGAPVVVDNAYLEFHRDFATQYQPPD